MVQIDVSGKRVDLERLGTELEAAAVPHNALATTGVHASGPDSGKNYLYTFDAQGVAIELPPEAQPVVDAHVAPPLLVEFASTVEVHTILRTTDAAAHEILRFPCEQQRLYQANLTISGVDAANFVSKVMEGRFTWKRVGGNAIMVGITVVSDIHDAAAASWAPNALPSGTDVVFTVQGAAGRNVDWLLVGHVDLYAPGGIA